MQNIFICWFNFDLSINQYPSVCNSVITFVLWTCTCRPMAPLPYAAMPAMSARPTTVPMGYYGQGNQLAFMPNPNWMTERELQQQLLQEQWMGDQCTCRPMFLWMIIYTLD